VVVGGTPSSPSLFLPAFPIPPTGLAFCRSDFRKRETGMETGGGVVSGWCGGGRIAGGTPHYFYTFNFKLPTICLSHDFLGKTSYKTF
jgi:hypothetical protein